MIYPSRIDHTMSGGATKTLEFQLSGVGTLDADTVEFFLSLKQGIPWHLKKVSAAGDHYDGDERIVRFTLDEIDVPPSTQGQTCWYEVWRTDPSGNSVPHCVGELEVFPTNRT